MGYRSDVRIRTTKEGYEVMKNFVEKYIKENVSEDAQGLDWNLLSSAESIDNNTHTFNYTLEELQELGYGKIN